MCETGVAAFTPFAALLPSQLEHRVQPWGLPFREDTDERSAVRALSKTSQGEGTGQKNQMVFKSFKGGYQEGLSLRTMKPW